MKRYYKCIKNIRLGKDGEHYVWKDLITEERYNRLSESEKKYFLQVI